MKDDEQGAKPEILIIRRGGGDEMAGGKGGAWKIAYADFVTAMMAFFLVMWLINASNEETRAQVASYFNPIKLTDTTTGARSLKDMKDNKNTRKTDQKGEPEGAPPSKKDVRDEADMLANPPKSLDHIAKTVSDAEFRNAGLENVIEITPSLKPDKTNPGVGDPFDPRTWDKAKQKPGETAGDEVSPEGASANGKTGSGPTDKAPAVVPDQTEADLKRDIASNLGGEDSSLNKAVEVRHSGTGVQISLTESESFEMFRTGSAEPEPQLLRLVDAIAAALQKRKGRIIIRGHTDSRPYRNKYYDNWQLSTARAHLARYMLIRGGLDETRIWRIEGVADREPRDTTDPQAATNRRIEILLEPDAP